MKKNILASALALGVLLLVSGCVASVGGGPKTMVHQTTLGQQLIDLQTAKNSGALTDAEYQQQKAKLLEAK